MIKKCLESLWGNLLFIVSNDYIVKQGHSIVEEVMCDLTLKKCKVLTRFNPATLKVFCIVYFQVPA